MTTPAPLALPGKQVTDSGLDETSCYFADGDGEEISHGHYFEELSNTYVAYDGSSSSSFWFQDFQGGDFFYDLSRRKVSVPRERFRGFKA